MRAVVQRCRRGSVTVAGEVVGAIDHGLVVLLGAGRGDTETDVAYVVDKLVNLRIFADDERSASYRERDPERDRRVDSA